MNDKNPLNTSHIPIVLQSVVRDVKTVCAELNSDGDFYEFNSDQWIYDIKSIDNDSINHVALILDVTDLLLIAYVLLRMPENQALKDSRESLVQAVSLANYGLLPGCFEIDLETGEIRYRSVLQVTSNGISLKDVARLISNALLIVQKYAPAFQKIVRSDVAPIIAIEEIENQD